MPIIVKRIGYGWFKAVSEEDAKATLAYPEDQLLEITVKGSKKDRSYRELSCYFGSCRYIANLNLDENKDTPNKVDFLTRVKCGFVEAMTVDIKTNRVFYQPKSLNYANCDQQDSHEFIAMALDKHSELVGLPVDEYIILLNQLK